VFILTLPKEHFTPSSHPVLGPSEGELSTDADPIPTTTKPLTAQLYDPLIPGGSKPSPQTPVKFGPDVISPEEEKKGKKDKKDKKEEKKEKEEQKEKPLMDEGTHRSDTATKSHSIYFYQPFASLPFPESSGAPQPFLNDFMPFQR
jgi:hypothetical protein